MAENSLIYHGVVLSLWLFLLLCMISLHILRVAKCQLQGGRVDMLSELCIEGAEHGVEIKEMFEYARSERENHEIKDLARELRLGSSLLNEKK